MAAGNIAGLREGGEVHKPVYDMKTGERVGFESVSAWHSKVIIVEGLFALTSDIAETADLTVFVDIETHGRMMRRLLRDTSRTSWSPSAILGYMNTVNAMHDEYVEPTKASADVIISNEYNPTIEALRAAGRKTQVKYKSTMTERDLQDAGGRQLSTSTRQVDTYYGPLTGSFDETGEQIRIRETADETLFCYEGPELDGVGLRHRAQVQFPIDNEALKNFEELYPDAVCKVYKDRIVFQFNDVIVSRDSVHIFRDDTFTPIGSFIEMSSDLPPEEAEARFNMLAEYLELSGPIVTPYSRM
jgi:predicted adenylyl cyclase CyaB